MVETINQLPVGNNPQPEGAGQAEVSDTPQQPNKEQDLLERVSKFAAKIAPPEGSAPEDGFSFNRDDINKIEDPQAKAYVENAYKSFERGFNKKFAEIAELRKSLESQQASSRGQDTWTPEAVQKLLNDPTFVQAASQVAGNDSDSGDDDSYLSDRDKERLRKVELLERELNNLKMDKSRAAIQQQHSLLKQKFPHYQPEAVDQIYAKMKTGEVTVTPEDVWRVLDYEQAVRRAYEMGQQDKNSDYNEKINSFSPEGGFASPSAGAPKRNEKEGSEDYFKRLGLHNLMKLSKNSPMRE